MLNFNLHILSSTFNLRAFFVKLINFTFISKTWREVWLIWKLWVWHAGFERFLVKSVLARKVVQNKFIFIIFIFFDRQKDANKVAYSFPTVWTKEKIKKVIKIVTYSRSFALVKRAPKLRFEPYF